MIELLVVIAIIAMLSGIIVASLGAAKQSSRDAKRIADIKNIQISLALYYNDNLKYPQSLTIAAFLPYLPILPKDPLPSQSYVYAALAPGSGGLGNCNAANKYHLGAILEQAGNAALSEDADRVKDSGSYTGCLGYASDFEGASLDCGTSVSSPDLCYDMVAN
ncbi:MAG: Uncharacterized protein G01um101456_310 [Parcubacteria group bacterium Gr01-1014_56]|nr:MAG: Uncharacterized protein G01um101456_310 [Parcubacteria group bacterium Gr01-1014_56]